MPEDIWVFLIRKIRYTTPIFLFINFESSFLFYFPFGIFILSLFIIFISRIFKIIEIKSIIKEILYHFFNLIYPRIWLIIILFFLIFIINFFRLVPRVFSLSSLPLITLRIRILIFSRGYLFSINKEYYNCISHFLPQRSPIFLSSLLVWIEIISWLCRPLALRVRLIANITARHLLIFLFRSRVYISRYFFILPLSLLIALAILEVGVSFIQAYVYLLLLSLYIRENLE